MSDERIVSTTATAANAGIANINVCYTTINFYFFLNQGTPKSPKYGSIIVKPTFSRGFAKVPAAHVSVSPHPCPTAQHMPTLRKASVCGARGAPPETTLSTLPPSAAVQKKNVPNWSQEKKKKEKSTKF